MSAITTQPVPARAVFGRWLLLVLGLWLALPGLATARERAVVGAFDISIEEGENTVVQNDFLAELRAHAPIHVGDLYDPQVLRDFVKALYAREVFGQIRVLKDEPEEGVVALQVLVIPRPEIRRIRFKGNHVFGDAELLRALRLREGDRFEPDDLNDENTRLLNYLRRQGYTQARITFSSGKRKDGRHRDPRNTERRPAATRLAPDLFRGQPVSGNAARHALRGAYRRRGGCRHPNRRRGQAARIP